MGADKSNNESSNKHRSSIQWFIALSMVLLVLGTALLTFRIDNYTRNLHEKLRVEAELVSWAIDAGEVKELIETEQKASSPLFARLSEQLDHAKTLYPYCRDLRVIYARPDHTVTTLIGNEDAPFHPDDTCVSATHKGLTALTDLQSKGKIRVCVPILDPLTSQTAAALVFEVEDRTRTAMFYREALPVMVYTFMMLLLTAGFFITLHHRTSSSRKGWMPEVVFVLLSGLLTTGIAMQTVQRLDHRSQTQAFSQIASGQVSQLQQAFGQISGISLEGIARFFDSSNFVDAREFSEYIGHLAEHPYTPAWLWMPEVEAPNLQSFEDAVRNSNRPEYRIYPAAAADTSHEHGSLCFPVCYVAPGMDDNLLSGLDLASIPSARTAIEAARTSRLTTASDPVRLTDDPSFSNEVLVVFRPVFNREDTNRLSGVVGSVLDPVALIQQLLRKNISHDDFISKSSLYEVGEQHVRSIFSTAEPAHPVHVAHGHLLDRNMLVSPVFAFGRVYALEIHPAPSFSHAYPHRGVVATAGAGLLTTGLLTLLAVVLANQRRLLEQTIHLRQNQLAMSEESYQGLFNSIRHALFVLDRDRKIVDVNAGAVELYGYTKNEIIGNRPEMFGSAEPDIALDFEHAFLSAWSGRPFHAEFQGTRKDGAKFPIEIWMYKSSYFGDEAVIAVANDISERKNAEQQQEELRAQLMQAQKMESIGRLAGGIAHDFNNMLQAILGNAALAREEVDENRSPLAQLIEIENSAKHSVALTRQLLAFASKQTIQPRPLNLNDAIGGMMNMLRILVGENIDLNWQPSPGISLTLADQNQIEQVIANLIVNARDAISGTGTISISTRNFECDRKTCREICTNCRPGKYVRITVADDGCGMDQKTIQNIFEPFYTTKQQGKGTGLGLATVFGIINQNKGVISVKSAPNKGTSMHIMLPQFDGQPEQETTSNAVSTQIHGTETILFVEDEASVLRLGVAALQSLGYTVLSAASPDEALAHAKACGSTIDMIISDVILPGMNGAELVDAIRKTAPDIPVLFISGYTADVISDQGIVDQSINFVQKPFTIPQLASKIREALHRAKT